MPHLPATDDLFFNRAGLDRARTEGLVDEALRGADDGELYLEYCQSESLSFDDGRLKSASFDTAQGFGLRSIAGEAAGYAHASELSEAAIRRAIAEDVEVREDAVFALAQLPGERAVDALFAVLADLSLPSEVRKQALFWLVQSDSKRAYAYIDRLLADGQ